MSALRLFILVARFEGLSFLILLGVAMPLKYLAGEPGAVRVFGMAHGVLFLAFVALLVRVAVEDDWPWRRSALAFVASLLPFGTFWFERRLRRDGALS
jgi:integral membrane protein